MGLMITDFLVRDDHDFQDFQHSLCEQDYDVTIQFSD